LYNSGDTLGMNKTVIAGLVILVLVVGVGSNMLFHMVEARSVSHYLLDSNSTAKGKLLLSKNNNSSEKKYPKIIGYTPF
jgi:hypothetical protein